MKKFGILLVGVAALLSVGCPVRSIFPLFTEKDMAFVPGLLGTWVGVEDANDVLSVKRAGEKDSYLIEYRSKPDGAEAERQTYAARLGRLGEAWFLDSFRDAEEYDLIPAHLFYRVWLEGDSLRLAALEGDWLEEMIADKKVDIAHLRRDNDIVLTATTAELQKLVRRFADDPEAFPSPGKFVRSKSRDAR